MGGGFHLAPPFHSVCNPSPRKDTTTLINLMKTTPHGLAHGCFLHNSESHQDDKTITVLETEVEIVGERVRGQEREREGGGGEEEEGRENQVLLTQNIGPGSFLLHLIVL